jgi:glycosyltransferase involved in cell wall biosynthesis
MSNLIILQTAAPDYRKKFFTELGKKFPGSFKLFAGNNYFEESVKTDDTIASLHKINNYYLLGRKALFQTGMWKESLFADRLIIELNPRIISNWLLLLLRKILLKKTTLWGHAWPAAGKKSSYDKLRHIMRLLGDEIICYTKTQAEELKEYMPGKKISYAPNALFYKSEMMALNGEAGNNIIYVGRLTKAKKPELAIRAFHSIMDKLPEDSKLIVVGDGEEKQALQNLVSELTIGYRVKLLGHIGEYSKLQELYSKAIVSVSPGYVGLSITQSFGFGIPIIISRYENHSPEIECAVEGKNALFFETDNVDDFASVILSVFNERDKWIKKRNEIQEYCHNKYSIEAMVDGYLGSL